MPVKPPTVARLTDDHLHIRARGKSEVYAPNFDDSAIADGVVDWDPRLDGIMCGEATMATDSDHAGERHLDGDEVLYVIAGRMRLVLEGDDGAKSEVPVGPGEAVIVPCGVWHRIEIDEPARFLFLGGGRTQIRLPAGDAPA
jgi:mannose-6-phosphate isomerase-like protein (cupin superfamily)